MPTARLIGPPVRSTPASAERTGGASRGLPEDLLQEASRRLGILSLTGAVLWVTGTLLGHASALAMNPGDPNWSRPAGNDLIALAATAASLALFAYTRRAGASPERVLDVGLAYMVLTALAIGVTMHWFPFPSGTPLFPMISWTGAVVIMFAAIIPSAPAKTLVAGLVAALMMPAGMLIARARGTWEFARWTDAIIMHYPDFLLVGVAAVISHVVTRLGQQVRRAREMGSYQLGELLGRGGMGEVYRASHRMLARPAAIKLIRPERLGAADVEAARLTVRRFHREAEAAANLRSSHTVQLYDFGVTEDETLYFVMELLDGMDLETFVREHGPVPAGRAIHILLQICESLEEAHARGLVHRDIKPANIHLGRVGLRYDFVKVLDFGLVKSVADGDGVRAIATRAPIESSLATDGGPTPGTPAYMAPELALGEPVDGRTDLYAVGCVAYYLLTGRLVFEAESAVQMVARHLRAEPRPPSARAPRPVPEALDRAVLACLAKSPDDRPASAGALRRMLAAVDAEPWGDEEARAWWTARRSGGVAGGALGAAGGEGAVGADRRR